MKLDKKQLPQLIVLGVLVLLCIGYVSFTVAKPKQLPPPPAPVVGQQADEAKENNEDAAEIVPAGIFPNTTIEAGRRDPFTPQALPVTGKKPAEYVQVAMRKSPVNVFKSQSGRVPPINPLAMFGQGGTPAPITAQPAEEPIPQFVLTGVVRGENNVAIVRVGQSERYVVKQGQVINGCCKVVYVYDDAVLLDYKNHRIYVKLGGAKNAD